MKKFFPLALIGAAIGAASYIFARNNKQHVEKTLSALDELEKEADASVEQLSQSIIDDSEA